MYLVQKEEADGRKTFLGGNVGYTTYEDAVAAIEVEEPITANTYHIFEEVATAAFTAPVLEVTPLA